MTDKSNAAAGLMALWAVVACGAMGISVARAQKVRKGQDGAPAGAGQQPAVGRPDAQSPASEQRAAQQGEAQQGRVLKAQAQRPPVQRRSSKKGGAQRTQAQQPATKRPAVGKTAKADKPQRVEKEGQAKRVEPVAQAQKQERDEGEGPLLRFGVVQQKLENGLRVVMSPDPTVPTVAVALYFDVGSRNEVPGRSGFAHLFEHMMFQGSRNVGKMEHFKLINQRGGSANGTTSHDHTNYFETLPSNELALGLWLEADRMRSLAITQANFENQRQTVMEERRQAVDNQPYVQSMLRINELAYGDYWPYAHSTIGDMRDLQQAPLEAVQAFFAAHYCPNNAVLSLAGDFEPEEALGLVRKYFGDIEPRARPDYEPGSLAPQKAERAEEMQDPLAELPAFHLAYHIPAAREPDHYPLEILAIVLGDGESSRLYQELVKQKEMLSQIHVGTDDRRGPDLFSFWAVLAKGRTGDQARQVIYRQLAAIAERGITERELQKAKNRVRAAFVFGLQSNLQRAQHLAEFEMHWGDAKLLLSEPYRYEAVTLDDVKRVAGRYFTADNRTVLDVLPAKSTVAAERQPSDGNRRTP